MAREANLSDIINKVLETKQLAQLSIPSRSGGFSMDSGQAALHQELAAANSSGSVVGGSVYKCPQIEQKHAKKLLDHLAMLANPICKKRGWRVGMLQEFYPNNPGLLGMNVNGGTSILIRLRSPQDHTRFLPWYDLIGTLCHELAHNEVGPHNEAFYALMNKIYDEVEKLPNYNAICNEIRRGDGIGYLAGTGKWGVAAPSSISVFHGTSEGHKLGNHSGSFPFPPSTLKIASNGEVVRKSNLSTIDNPKLSLKEKMALAAMTRAGASSAPHKLGTGSDSLSSKPNNSSSSSSSNGSNNNIIDDQSSEYKNLDRDEMRKLVLTNLEHRMNRERGGSTSSSGSNDSCLCNNNQRQQRPAFTRGLPDSKFCKPVSNSSVNKVSSSHESSLASNMPQGASDRRISDATGASLYFPYSSRFPDQSGSNTNSNNNTNNDKYNSIDGDDSHWLCQICLDFNAASNTTCIFCGYQTGSVLDLDDNRILDSMSAGGEVIDLDSTPTNRSDTSETAPGGNSPVSSITSSTANGDLKRSKEAPKDEFWNCLVCCESNKTNRAIDVELCVFCGVLRGYTIDNEIEKQFLQSI